MPRAVVLWYPSTTTRPSIDVHADRLGVELVSVGDAAGGHQHRVGPHCGAVVEFDDDLRAVLLCAHHVAVAADLPLLARDVGVAHAQRVVAVGQHGAAADHQRDAAAQRREDMGEFGGDETAADDHQMLGQLGNAHDRVAGVERHPTTGYRLGHHH